jgi:acid stress chaperone HdeB
LEVGGISVRYRTLIVGVVLLVAASAPASAQIKLDMNKITCGEWLGYGPADRDFVRFFMSGYYNAAANSNVLDYNRLEKNSAKVMAFCKKRKLDTLPTAIKKAAS